MIFIALLALSQAATRDTIHDFEPDELMAVAPYGVDVTPDETVWINMAAVGRSSDYAVRARDFVDRKPPYVKVWIRGYHIRNPKVAYRESKSQISFDCSKETYSTAYAVYYRADGSVFSETRGEYGYRPVVPGTEAANWFRFICQTPAKR